MHMVPNKLGPRSRGALGWWLWLPLWVAMTACTQPSSSPRQAANRPTPPPPLMPSPPPANLATTTAPPLDAAAPKADGAATVPPEARFAAAQTPQLPASEVCSRPVAEVPGMRVLGREHGYADFNKPFGCIAQSVWQGDALLSLADSAARWIGPPTPPGGRGADRGRSALRFIQLVYFAFEPVLDHASAAFRRPGAPKFAAPRIETLRDGSLVATLFTQPPFPGPFDIVRRWRLHFAADGRLLEAVPLQQKIFDWHSDPEFLRSDGKVDK